MNMPDNNLVVLIALAFAAFALLLAVVAWVSAVRSSKRLQHSEARAADLQTQLELVRQSITGLTAGAVGMDRKLQQLAARERVLSERQETYENQQVDDQPYSHAIRLVQQGASVSRLVEELELSESEAELIVRLHGHRDSA
ncbi:DUF2802 domain-containing protein [Thiosocius teredinicola]|uniref:DUF2802 domain-containing protein n=1 Tax=Thiosocius teredinicola TaxID=1973002 RepID=UPI0013DE491A